MTTTTETTETSEQFGIYNDGPRARTKILRIIGIVVAALSLLFISFTTGISIGDDSEKVAQQTKKIDALTTKNDDLYEKYLNKVEEAKKNEEAATQTELCRSAGVALARAGVERNDLIVKVLSSGAVTDADSSELEASNDAFTSAVLQLKICDPTLTSNDIGL